MNDYATIFCEYDFCGAHSLPHLPDGHPCRRLHGHNFHLRLEVTGPIDPAMGWVIDYGEINVLVGERVLAKLDHRLIDEVVSPSTCECVARWIWQQIKPDLPGLTSVEVREFPRCGVIYRG